jgi:oxygen-independent coproporphyrinogen-3 oxidase
MPWNPYSTAGSGSGLYLHVPFCSAICPYCDFAVMKGGEDRRAAYVDALVAEAALYGEGRGGWTAGAFDTVYLGGGTPSALSVEQLGRLLAALREHLPVAEDARISLEANPEDVTPGLLAGLRELGASTLSLGVQSFDPAALKFLGRRHTAEDARRAVEAALARVEPGGFDAVSVDVIFGLPQEKQGPDGLARTLATVAELAPQHVSCYQLTFHQGTPFFRGLERGVIRELPEPAQAEAYERVLGALTAAGYEAYEVSNFAREPRFQSRHNAKYWDHTPYLGLGPSAHSFDGVGGRRRWWNEREEGAWRARVLAGERPVAGEELLGREELATEALMLGLRTARGVDLGAFRERFGVDLVARNRARVERLEAEGLVVVEGEWLRPTLKGFAVADGLPLGFEVGEGE